MHLKGYLYSNNLFQSIKQIKLLLTDGEVPVMLELWECGAPFIAIAPTSTLSRRGSTW